MAWRYQDGNGNYRYRGYVAGFDVDYRSLKPVPLYAAPPAAKESLTTDAPAPAQEPVALEYTMPVSGERIASVERKLLPNERPLYGEHVPAQMPGTAEKGGVMSQHTPAPQPFVDYMKKNYPEGTVISDAAWHARPIWNAACHALQNDPLTRAAPDLLDALESLLDYYGDPDHDIMPVEAQRHEAARAAIKKARGE